jgi:Uncharacterized protein conserved in bacteria
MASSLLILLDDIATVLDDVAVMSKMAAKKTAGVLGDDLALNAQQVSGVRAERELPVVWGVAKGSFINKLILVPLALLISVVAPWLINPLLMIGGLFLCYEGVEKVLHSLKHKKAKTEEDAEAEFTTIETDLATFEKEKIKGAIRTDFHSVCGNCSDFFGHRGSRSFYHQGHRTGRDCHINDSRGVRLRCHDC